MRVSTLKLGGCQFDTWPGHTKGYKINMGLTDVFEYFRYFVHLHKTTAMHRLDTAEFPSLSEIEQCFKTLNLLTLLNLQIYLTEFHFSSWLKVIKHCSVPDHYDLMSPVRKLGSLKMDHI